MKPPGNAQTIVNYGNATSPFVGAFAGIDERIGRNGPTMGAPNFTGNAPRLPLLERLTPPNVNATQGITTAQAHLRTNIIRFSKRTTDLVSGYARSLAMRQRRGGGDRILSLGIRWGG